MYIMGSNPKFFNHLIFFLIIKCIEDLPESDQEALKNFPPTHKFHKGKSVKWKMHKSIFPSQISSSFFCILKLKNDFLVPIFR